MMTVNQIKQEIKNQIGILMNIDLKDIDDTDTLIGDLGADSIVIIQLFISCEEAINVRISEELDLYKDLSIEELAEMIHSKCS